MIVPIPADEINRSLKGAFRILFKEPDALSFFNLTPQGFWNSFRAFFIILGPFGLAALADRQFLINSTDMTFETFPSNAFFILKLAGMGIEWVAMPFLLWLAADLLQIKARYIAYVIARNWGSVIVAVAFAVPAIADLSGFVIHEVSVFAQLLLFGFAMVYHYRIALVTLDKPPLFCLAIVFADLLFGLMLGQMLFSAFSPFTA